MMQVLPLVHRARLVPMADRCDNSLLEYAQEILVEHVLKDPSKIFLNFVKCNIFKTYHFFFIRVVKSHPSVGYCHHGIARPLGLRMGE